MNCKICNAESGQEKYCPECRTHIGKLSERVGKKEVGKNSIHSDIVKMLTELSEVRSMTWFKKDQGMYSQIGISDFSITAISDITKPFGIHIACEVKAGKNKLSALQAEYLKNHIEHGGGIGIVVRSAAELNDVINSLNDIADKLRSGTPYHECHKILARSRDEILSTLAKVKKMEGANGTQNVNKRT